MEEKAWLLEQEVDGHTVPRVKKWSEQKVGPTINLKAQPRDPLPPASLYLPKLLRPSEVGPAVEDQVLDA